ncbi:uncharacterized protein F5891DRAFT_980435 [Suillus fuscotomentosus]|uniref:Protein kinase domain-containing protein n=1 Tax=Suillus fuscotomentosus TaxID=1912939 RepID=A0AAD4E5W5_9AGAM|nr:uncharacterized protein F5891DRAFT_980435 [Suillus fuscotomentosus]KAG1900142.1 hypothetical protein F5891DRAFT_980435 [Suillus fuscotomentosus]
MVHCALCKVQVQHCHYLLATVTSSIPAGGDFLPCLKEDMDLLMKNELLPVGKDSVLAGGRQVLWEEGIKERKSSILDALIPKSDLTTKDILSIRYIKKKGETLLQGASLLQDLQTGLQWRLDGAFSGSVKKLRQWWELQNDETDATDLEDIDEDSMMDTDGSWSQQLFYAGQKRPNLAVKTSEEKCWEHLLWSIYYAMRNIIREATDEYSESDSPNPLPFNTVPEPRYWSSEFSTTPIPDATDSRKPDLVLMDYRLKSGKKTWADVLTNIEITKSELVQGKDIPIFLGVAMKGYLIIVLPDGVDFMLEGAKGWVIDNDSEVYWIMDILWKSRGLFLRGTICYCVQDQHGSEFVLKDCWVDAANLDHEVMLLQAVDGIPNVVTLKKYWDAQYAGQTDCTSRIREHIYSSSHAIDPLRTSLTTFNSIPEVVNVFQDLVIAHEAMVTQQNILHSDLSPNNIIIHDRKGYFIDFDHAKFLEKNAVVDSRGTGTVPYISSHLLKLMGDILVPSMIDHRASDDLESLFYIFLKFTMTYEGPGGKASTEGVQPVNAPRWHKAYLMMDQDGLGTSGSLKKDFLMEKCPHYEPTPYFQVCHPILED